MPTKRKKKAEAKTVLGRERKSLVMVRSAVDPDVRFFLASEMADDHAIQESVMGKMVAACVYEFQQDGKPIRGLTVQGVKEAARVINANPKSGMRIALEEKMFIENNVEMNGQAGVMVKTLAVDHISGMRNWGVKFEAYKKYSKYKKTWYEDTFVLEKAVSKAQRNAIAGLIPLQLKFAIIEQFAKDGKAVQLPPPPTTMTEVKEVKKTPPKELSAIIKSAIESTDDPEQLQNIAEKCEQSPKLSEAAKKMLSSMAKGKLNAILDKRAKLDEFK